MQRAGVEQRVPRLPEHRGHLVVVVGHELRLRGLLGEGEQAVDVLNGFERFLQTKSQTNLATQLI